MARKPDRMTVALGIISAMSDNLEVGLEGFRALFIKSPGMTLIKVDDVRRDVTDVLVA